MTTYYVGSGGNNANAGTSWALRKLTLNGAEDIPVAAGDTVYVAPGVYRETLTVDVSGSAGSPVTYIGDYTGANTDGVGGVVRITGSDDDITVTRTQSISASADRAYRTFRGFLFDLTTNAISFTHGAGCVYEQCAFVGISSTSITLSGANQASAVIRNCLFVGSNAAFSGISLTHTSTVSGTGHEISNCVFIGGANNYALSITRVGGAAVKNCLVLGYLYACRIQTALAEGQTTTWTNCIIVGCTNGLRATVEGEITENYNTFYGTSTARTNVATGANSNTYPPLFDTRWFFEAVNGGDMVTPFDLASYSQLINVAGTSPPAADMRGTTVQGAQREWGALEYDSTLYLAGDDAADYPSEDDVRDGTAFSTFTGNMTLPAVGNVRDGETYGTDGTELEGTLELPAVATVLDSASYGEDGTEYTGTYHATEVAEVLDSVSFGAASAETGTYHAPDAAEVIDTAVFGPASGTSGTFAIPAEGDVEAGVDYGAAAEFTGTFVVPAVEDVKLGEGYGAGGVEFTGTYAAGGGDPDDIAAAVLAAMNLTPPAVNVTYSAGVAVSGRLAEVGDLPAVDANGRVDVGLWEGEGKVVNGLSYMIEQGFNIYYFNDVALFAVRGILGMATGNLDAQLAALPTDQDVRDAMKLAPTTGAPATGSVDKHLDDLEASTAAILVDTSATLPALISAGGSGTGLYSETITVNDGDGLPVDGVLVQVATDSAFSNVVRGGYTNNLGQVTLNFDATGTYYGRAEISDFNVATFTVTIS